MWAEPGFMISFWILCVTFYARSHQLQKGNGREIWISSRDKTCESFKRCWRRTWVCTEAQPAETGDRRKCLHISSSTKRSWITGKMHIHVERAASTLLRK
uniref:Secreted protein n=1 Tax=Oryza punctata TaxID=4537 RepID=A0A0E0M1G0_ORYPU